MDEIESFCRECEAVENAGEDIAHTYGEYVHVA